MAMSMTRTEAIRQLETLRDHCRSMIRNVYEDAIWVQDVEALDVALAALHPVSREQVEKAWRGEWKHYLPPLGAGDVQCRCTRCGQTPDVETPFCAWCGAPMTGEAVEMVVRRLETLHEKTD